MGGDLHHPLDGLVLAARGPVQSGVAVLPHPEEALLALQDPHELSPHLLVVRVVYDEARVAALVLLVNIVQN
mgnify:CR=1 FL=1